MADLAPRVGKTFTAVIHRIDEDGNGIIETKESHINIGPVLPGSEGEWVEALKLPGGYARCNRAKVLPDDYKEQINEQFPHDLPLGPGEGHVGGILGKRDHGEEYQEEKYRPVSRGNSGSEGGSAAVQVGETHAAEVDRISNSGNGIVYVEGQEINVGSLSEEAVGSEVEVEITGPQTGEVLSTTTSTPAEQSAEETEAAESDTPSPKLDELREDAVADAEEEPEAFNSSTSTSEYSRSAKIKKYVKARADGVCEGCGEPAPFTSVTGEPYLHAHHIDELSDGGSDTPETVVALCPNCHYRVHHGKDGEEFNQELRTKLVEIEG